MSPRKEVVQWCGAGLPSAEASQLSKPVEALPLSAEQQTFCSLLDCKGSASRTACDGRGTGPPLSRGAGGRLTVG